MTRTETTEASPQRHPRVREPVVLITTIVLSALGALIGMHMITTLGVTANTSIIGALIAMLIGRVGFGKLRSMRSPHRQNLVQSAVSASTFAAANSLLTPMAVLFAFGRGGLVLPMLVGVTLALLIDGYVFYRVFGSRVMPAGGAWPPGAAAAETIRAGDRGGKRAMVLGASALVGVAGSWSGLSMSAAGVAFIGNAWALGMFGLGLCVAQYAPLLLHVQLSALYIPHGLMIGAGLVALVQAASVLLRRDRTKPSRSPSASRSSPAQKPAATSETAAAGSDATSNGSTVEDARARRGLLEGLVLFALGAVVLAVLTGLHSNLGVPALIGWVVLAAVAALVHELIVGLAAMHAGWFPAFAVTLIFLIFGLLVGLPPLPLAVLVGYCAATGPAFADMGYDFKAGWILRNDDAAGRAYELAGRRQQFLAAILGFAAAVVVVALLWHNYFHAGDIPPVSKVYASTIRHGIADPHILKTLLLWAIPGAVIQLIGGSKRQLGVLLATGLLVATPNACWLVFGALLVRGIYTRIRGEKAQGHLALIGAGLIAGDAIASTSKVVNS